MASRLLGPLNSRMDDHPRAGQESQQYLGRPGVLVTTQVQYRGSLEQTDGVRRTCKVKRWLQRFRSVHAFFLAAAFFDGGLAGALATAAVIFV